MLYGLPPHSVIYKINTAIYTPKDLEGKKIGAAAGDSVCRVFPAFAQIAGFDIDKVQFETIGYEVYNAELLSGRIDGLAEYYAAKPNYDAAAKENGIPTGHSLSSPIMVSTSTPMVSWSRSRSSRITQTCCAISYWASIEDLNYPYKNPDEAVDIMMKYAPTLDRDVVKAQFLLDKPAVLTPDVLANGYGHIDSDKMQRTVQHHGPGV